MAEQQLAAMHLERENAGAFCELPGPDVLRLGPGAKARRSLLIWLLVARGEEARQRGVLRERQHPAIDEKLFGLVQRLQGAVRGQPAVLEALLAELGEGRHRAQGSGPRHRGSAGATRPFRPPARACTPRTPPLSPRSPRPP